MTNSQRPQSEKLGTYRGRENAARTPRNEKIPGRNSRATRARGRQKLGPEPQSHTGPVKPYEMFGYTISPSQQFRPQNMLMLVLSAKNGFAPLVVTMGMGASTAKPGPGRDTRAPCFGKTYNLHASLEMEIPAVQPRSGEASLEDSQVMRTLSSPTECSTSIGSVFSKYSSTSHARDYPRDLEKLGDTRISRTPSSPAALGATLREAGSTGRCESSPMRNGKLIGVGDVLRAAERASAFGGQSVIEILRTAERAAEASGGSEALLLPPLRHFHASSATGQACDRLAADHSPCAGGRSGRSYARPSTPRSSRRWRPSGRRRAGVPAGVRPRPRPAGVRPRLRPRASRAPCPSTAQASEQRLPRPAALARRLRPTCFKLRAGRPPGRPCAGPRRRARSTPPGQSGGGALCKCLLRITPPAPASPPPDGVSGLATSARSS